MSAVHISTYGQFRSGMKADLDGFVHTSLDSALAGEWDFAGQEWTEEEKREHFGAVVEANIEAVRKAKQAIQSWRDED